MKTLGDIFNQVIVRSGIQTTVSSYITDTMVKTWINDAYLWASAYHKWPMTEGRISTTFATGSGANSDEYLFEGYKADSFRFMTIGKDRLQKLNFEDYQNYLDENPAGDDRVYSDYGRLVYINPSIGLSGTLTAYGQFQPATMDITDHDAVTVFTNFDTEANEGIANEALHYMKLRERKFTEADYHHNKALEHLENVWKRLGDEQAMYQTRNRSIWERIDCVNGDYYDDSFNENQF